MLKNTSHSDFINMHLRQMGATSITTTSAKIHLVKFDFDNGESVTYSYTATEKGEFLLHRTDPFPINKGKFDNENDLLEYINDDVVMLRNAVKTNSDEDIIEVGEKLMTMVDSIEDMFYYCDVHDDRLDDIRAKLDDIDAEIKQIIEESPKVVPIEE